MSEFNFKVGAEVYYPSMRNKILTLVKTNMTATYPIMVNLGSARNSEFHSFMTNGKSFDTSDNPSIFPATQEWYDKLVHVYPDLEKPPIKKSSQEIIQAMLDDGWSGVPCYVSDFCSDDKTKKDIIVQFDRIGDYVYRTTREYGWQYATPFDPKTGKDIIDYVDGEVVLGIDNVVNYKTDRRT